MKPATASAAIRHDQPRCGACGRPAHRRRCRAGAAPEYRDHEGQVHVHAISALFIVGLAQSLAPGRAGGVAPFTERQLPSKTHGLFLRQGRLSAPPDFGPIHIPFQKWKARRATEMPKFSLCCRAATGVAGENASAVYAACSCANLCPIVAPIPRGHRLSRRAVPWSIVSLAGSSLA